MTVGYKNEAELWRDFLSGEEDAYTQLYKMHVKAMYRYGMSLVSISEAFIFDCIHDVFTELWVRRERLSVPDNIKAYLFRSLKNRILHLLKREERPQMFVVQDSFDDLWFDISAEDILLQKEESSSKQELVSRLVSQLPHRQQEALRLRFVEEMDYQEIGEMLDVNRQSAQNLVFRAVEKLRGWLVAVLFPTVLQVLDQI